MADDQDRPPLTRARAVREATVLADAEGVRAVSMRNLAARLGVVPMALYKHVANKEDLLDGMVDLFVAELPVPDRREHWRTAVRDTVLAARRAVVARPWLRSVIQTRTRRTPAVLGHMDAVAGAFLAGGFSADLTHHAMHALGHRLWGFSPEAFDAPDVPDDATVPADPDEVEAIVARMSEAYPSIAAVALAAVDGDLGRLGGGCDEQFEFEFGLDLLLDGFERLCAVNWCSRP
ncbi:TetR/AcrR family transcriptional regulator C-terminal domain-containing protein [Pseudonocardia sp. NPDC049635]|uniref:TetR/AcrR family transcriptional regulator n=1 Tax=Pseudonocardia sp. NPDC049635 TaxID=3155506 RepID=UPI0033C3515B